MEWDVFNYQLPTVTIVSGGARGADILCEKIAKEKNWVIEQHIPDWKKFSRSAGFVRNDYMISLGADACFAFIKDDSAGATYTAKGAVKAGIPTRIIGIRNGVEYEDRCNS